VPSVAQRLAALHGEPLNYDPHAPHPVEDGWRFDNYCEPLPSEAPGPPEERGAFAIAQTLLREYRVADPRIVRAHYDEDAPLEGRDMLLELRFLFFRIYAGCRVGECLLLLAFRLLRLDQAARLASGRSLTRKAVSPL